MARTLHFLVWIAVVTSSTAYKYPIRPQQLNFAPFPLDSDSGQDYSAPVPDCRVNTRSSEATKTYPTRTDDPSAKRTENSSAKILNNYKKPAIISRRGEISSNQIVFPGPTASSDRYLEPEIPESCQHATLCEEVPNYPRELINSLIEQLPELRNFQKDKLDVPETPDITQRLGPTEENIELCNSVVKISTPESGKAKDGKWYMVVNSKEKPVQSFKVEMCENPDGPCSAIAVFAPGYTARCVQKYVYRTAVVAVQKPDDKTLGTMEVEIKVPSCCSCVAKADIN